MILKFLYFFFISEHLEHLLLATNFYRHDLYLLDLPFHTFLTVLCFTESLLFNYIEMKKKKSKLSRDSINLCQKLKFLKVKNIKISTILFVILQITEFSTERDDSNSHMNEYDDVLLCYIIDDCC